jgi:subtilase family serine protease
MDGMRSALAILVVISLIGFSDVLADQPRDPGTIDLQLSGDNITVTPPQPGPPRLNDNLTVSARLNNLGTDPASNVSLIFSYNTTNTSLAPIEQVEVGTVLAQSNITVTAHWNTSGLGLEPKINYSIWVQAITDPNETDADTSNNMAFKDIVLQQDVIPVIEALTAEKYSAHVGDPIGLKANLTNAGIRPALCESVSFHLDSAPTPFAQRTANLPPGIQVVVPVLWSATSNLTDGNHTITVKVRDQSMAVEISFRYWTNPYFSSIQASSYSGNVGDRLFINATVNNNGTDNATQVPINYYLDAGGVPIGNVTVGLVPVGKDTTVPFLWDTYFMSPPLQPGNHTVKARIAGTPRDIRTGNISFGSQMLSDLTVTAFTISKSLAFIGELLDVNITVANVGKATPHFDSSLQVVLNSVTPINEVNVTQLAPGESFDHSFKWPTHGLDPRVYTLRAQADQYDVIRETNESNNGMKLDVSFKGAVDIAVDSIIFTRSQNLTNETSNVTAGDGLWVWVTVANRGTIGSAPNTTMAVYLDGSAAPLRTFSFYSIGAGRNFTFNFFWDTASLQNATSPADHVLLAWVDEARLNEEVDRENNNLAVTVTVLPRILDPDLVVLELRQSISAVRYEEALLLTAHVANLGGRPAINVTLRFTFKGAGSPQLIKDQIIPEMKPGEHYNRTQDWRVLVSEGNYTLSAVLDPQNAVAANHSRNIQSANVTVMPAQQLGPDLRVNITTNPLDPVDGEKVIVSVTVKNIGDTSAADLLVTMLVNGRPAGNTSITELAPGDVRTVSLYWTARAGGIRIGVNVTGANFSPVTGTSLGLDVAPAPVASAGYLPVLIVIIVLIIAAVALMATKKIGTPPGKDEEEE